MVTEFNLRPSALLLHWTMWLVNWIIRDYFFFFINTAGLVWLYVIVGHTDSTTV